MWVTLAILSSIIFGIASVIMKSATLKKCSDHYILWGLYFSGTLFFLATSFSSLNLEINVALVASSILIAIGSFFGNWFVIKALEVGPASLTAPMLNLNLPCIILMSVLFYGEELNLIKIIIIFILLLAVFMVKVDPNESMVVKNKKWFIWVILGAAFLFLREGGLKITQEMGLNNQVILFYSYLLCLIFSSVSILRKEQSSYNTDKKKKLTFNLSCLLDKSKLNGVYFGLVTGICSGLGLYLYSEALSIGPASLVALIFSARSMVIVLFSYLLHKERLSLFQKCSVLFLCVGLSLASFIK